MTIKLPETFVIPTMAYVVRTMFKSSDSCYQKSRLSELLAMTQSAASRSSEQAQIEMRKAGMRLLAWPLLNCGGMVYYWIAPNGKFRLHIDPTFLIFGFLAFRLMRGEQRYTSPALVACWTFLIAGLPFIAGSLVFPDTRIWVVGFIVLFELSQQNALLALCLHLVIFGWPIIPLLRARKAIVESTPSH